MFLYCCLLYLIYMCYSFRNSNSFLISILIFSPGTARPRKASDIKTLEESDLPFAVCSQLIIMLFFDVDREEFILVLTIALAISSEE